MRFAVLPFGVCFLLVVLLGSALSGAGTAVVLADGGAPPKLEDVLRDVREASGAPYRFHVVSTSRERIGGADFELTSESQGARYLVSRCSRGICNGLFVDGERGSTVNINGTALPLPIDIEPLQGTLRAIATDAFAAPEFAANGGRLEQESDGVAGGVRVNRMVVATAHGAPLDVAIDATTHLVQSVATQGSKNVFTFKDYRKTGGMMLPFEIDINGQRNQVFESRGRADGDLNAPAGLVPTFQTGAASERIAAGRPPTAACTIAGMATSCLIDTGNSGMAMSPELARKLGLTPVASENLGVLGDAVAGIVRAGPLQIAGATYPEAIYVVVRNLHRTGADLALGADAFAHATVTIDFPGRSLTIAPEAAMDGGFPITFENFIPVTGTSVGPQAAPVDLDTGDADAVTVPDAFYRAHKNLFANATTKANGDIVGTVRPVRIGPFVVASAAVTSTKLLTGPARGHVGTGVLQHFRLTFDYAHERFNLVPARGDAAVTVSP